MYVTVNSAKCTGIEAVKVTIETDVDRGIGIHLVGLADIAVKESLLRTTTALESLGYHIPGKRIVINMAPADLRKNGSIYDVPIAVSIIAASEQMSLPLLDKYLIMGELGLDGSIRPIPGALPCVELVKQENLKGMIIPINSALETIDFKEIEIYGVENLQDVLKILSGEDARDTLVWNTQVYRIKEREAAKIKEIETDVDFADVIGQEAAKRAVEIAAAGGHNLLLIGAPGSGKSTLAKTIPGIMPPMLKEEALITSKIYSVAGNSYYGLGLMKHRPYRAPHCSVSLNALIGGGSSDAIVPGEVSLANGGVLFLDEIGQMSKSSIEALRAPVEDRQVTISRLRGKVTYPSSFMLVTASNPCPCGYWGEGQRCRCTPTQRQNYLNRLSGPIMDRIDLHCWMHCVSPDDIEAHRQNDSRESSKEVAARVLKARIEQKYRFAKEKISTNAEMNNKQIEKYCPLSEECKEALNKLMDAMQLSMRAYFRIIKVARTIADLSGSKDILPKHIVEAASYRFMDKMQ